MVPRCGAGWFRQYRGVVPPRVASWSLRLAERPRGLVGLRAFAAVCLSVPRPPRTFGLSPAALLVAIDSL
eukprot:698231-Lingulodinium_polyedra.AAC.1